MFHLIDTIYCDFDGTIATIDAINTFFSKYAQKEWLKIEQDWSDGKIGSLVCMEKQVELVCNLDKELFYNYMDSIQITEGFKEFCSYMHQLGRKVIIVSDGFDVFIDYILKKNNIENVSFYANKLVITEENNKLNFKLDFPYKDESCNMSLGVCKCKIAINEKPFMYIGDGLSDRCIAKKAGLLFAKNNPDTLQKYCTKEGIPFNGFDDFYDILKNINIKEGQGQCKV